MMNMPSMIERADKNPPAFLYKLVKVVDDPSTDHLIRWSAVSLCHGHSYIYLLLHLSWKYTLEILNEQLELCWKFFYAIFLILL